MTDSPRPRCGKGKGKEAVIMPDPSPRTATLRRVRHPVTDETLDHQALAIFFPGETSASGEPTLELHLHGSRAITRAVLAALSDLSTVFVASDANKRRVRPAEPGEFTRSAFLKGKMDLTEVEGLRDLIESETEGQRKLALRMADVSRLTCISLSFKSS